MTNFRKYFFLVIVLLSLTFQNVIAQNVKDIYVFLVDQSGSMRQDNLSERVKIELENFIRDEVAINDKLLIMGFGDKVTIYYNDTIDEMKEKDNAYNVISKLKSNHNWTHMSVAFRQLADRLNELNELYPQSNKYVYVFTDGKNDPPPALNEKPELFRYILGKHFGMNKLKELKSFIYYISFGIKAPNEIVEIERKSENFKVAKKPREEEDTSIPIIPVEIKLKLKKDSFKLIKNKSEIVELEFKVLSITRASDIKFSFENKEKIVSVSKKNKKFDIIFSPNKLSEGNHKMFVNVSSLDDNGKIRPGKFEIKYEVIIPDYTFWYISGGVLLLIIILVIIYKMLPTFSGKLVFIKNNNEYPKRLSGKFCKRLSDLQRGWGIPISMKVCPDSTGSRIKLKFKLTEKRRQNLMKNGLKTRKSPEIIRTGDIIKYGDWEILYDRNKKR